MDNFFSFIKDYVKSIFAALINPVDNIDFDFSWVLIASNLFIATLWFFYVNIGRGRDFSHWAKAFFSRKVWFHKSTRSDFLVILINGFFFSLFIATYSMPSAGVIKWTYDLLSKSFGEVAIGTSVSIWYSVLYTVCMFCWMDFVFYWVHRMYHRVPFLWRFHKRHHTAEVLTLLTVSRGHPVSTFVNINIYIIAFGTASGFFMYIFGSGLGEVRVFGLNILTYSSAFLGGLLSHSHIRLRFPRLISNVFLSPVMHQAHHSKDVAHYDKNFSSTLAIYDRIFGTIHIPAVDEKHEFGVDEPDRPNHQNLFNFYFKL